MKSMLINTVEDAARFLECIDIEVIGLTNGWILHCIGDMNDDLELNCDTNEDLIEWARDERDICVRACAELGLGSIEALAAFWNSSLPAAHICQTRLTDWMSSSGSNNLKEVTE